MRRRGLTFHKTAFDVKAASQDYDSGFDWRHFMLKFLRIQGESMTPEYQDGDFVLIMRVRRPREGQVIVFHNQLYGTLIKRIEKITQQGIYVVGTGENSLDSRRLGPINPEKVMGKVIWHIKR